MALALTGSVLALVASPAAALPVPGTSVTYTEDAHFDNGVLVNVNHDAPNNNQLQLNKSTGTFPFIWVALSQRCTIAKINTDTGAILGEYRTVSDNASCHESSRTTVSLDGSVWVGHRGPGGVTHVGLKELNQCVDRNGNGTIETSTAYGDVKAWAGAASVLTDAEDECILHHVNTSAAGLTGDSRHMSIDANNKLWVGDFVGGHRFTRINGTTGAIELPARAHRCGGYGGLIDENGVIWSANAGLTGLLRWDPDAPDSATNPRCIEIPVYGLAVDQGGSIWATDLGAHVRKVSADGNTIQGPFPHGAPNGQGLAVDGNGDVWVSSALFCNINCTVGHLKNDGTFVGNVPNPTGGGSTGVSVDAAGKVWTANRSSHTATRIDPGGGPLGCGGTGCGSGTRLGAADLTVSFPATGSRPVPFPYNYSDMTGAQLFSSTAPQGSWTVVQDGGAAGTSWGKATWNTEPQGDVPAGTSITIEARAADTEAGLGGQSYITVANGTPFSIAGRFIQVRATLKANAAGKSPVLSDIKIETANKPPVFDSPPTPACGSTQVVNTGSTLTFAVQASDPDAGQNVMLTGAGVPAGATMTPALPTSGNPAMSTFSWAPTPADEGTHTMTFTATDPFGARATCTIRVRVVALIMTGRALVAKVHASSLGMVTLNAVVNDTGDISTKVPLDRRLGVDATAAPVAASLLKASVVTTVGSSEAKASAATVLIDQPGVLKVEATAVAATSRTTCAGSTGGARVATGNAQVQALKVAGAKVDVAVDARPNTTYSLPGGITVIINEQVLVPGELLVNAVHIKSSTVDIVLASARSDIHNCV